jgi:hypothetical protein
MAKRWLVYSVSVVGLVMATACTKKEETSGVMPQAGAGNSASAESAPVTPPSAPTQAPVAPEANTNVGLPAAAEPPSALLAHREHRRGRRHHHRRLHRSRVRHKRHGKKHHHKKKHR